MIPRMATSAAGIALLSEFEGTSKTMYPDQAGIPTIGRGHKLTSEELATGKLTALGIDWREGITDAEIELLFQSDLRPVEDAINADVLACLSQNKFDALASFVYNIGVPGFASSGALTCINRGDFDGAAQHMSMWVHSGDKVLPVLEDRRAKEIALWKSA